MSDGPKLVHVSIVDGEPEMIRVLSQELNKLKEKLDNQFEFLVTNDKIQVRDVKYLIDELYILYKRDKELKEATKNAKV